MSNVLRLVCSSLLLLLWSPVSLANSYADAIRSFNNAGASGSFFQTAYGYAVFPTIGKGGFFVGGAYGEGRVFVNARHVGDTTMTQLTLGFQLGAQAYSQIIFFENQQAFDHFTSGNFEFSAQATAVAITAGVSAEASTGGGLAAGASGGRNDATTSHGGYRKGLAVFTIATGGLMYEASLGGQKYTYTPLVPTSITVEETVIEEEYYEGGPKVYPVNP
ncbi:MAG: lipid-binding SYLF domain-containing protein [Pseudomonadota bacterium]